MRKYPPLPCLVITLLLAVASYVIWTTIVVQLYHPTASDDSTVSAILPVPVAVAVVQVCGLFMTVMLAFFPIQSAAFHQSKKALLDEILSLLMRYESCVSEISDGIFKHQTGQVAEDLKESRASLSTRQKSSQSLRDQIASMLPKRERKILEDASLKWWSSMFDEEGWVTNRSRFFKANDPYCEKMLQAKAALVRKLGEIRKKCLFDQIPYWRAKN
jgi:hypothetical protein